MNFIKQTPVVMALGALLGASLYFLLPSEPSLTLFYMLSIFTALSFVFVRFQPQFHLVALLTLSFFLTFSWTTYRTQGLGTVMLDDQYSDQRYWVIGEISEIEKWTKKARITIVNPKIYGVPEDQSPSKVRVTAHLSRLTDFKPGHWISVQAKLMSISTPQYPGAMDFKRWSYLHGYGAQGYVMGEIYRTSHKEWRERLTPHYYLERARYAIHERILEATGEGGGLASSLLTGIRDRIPKEVVENFRESGLSHILAISGLHIGLVGGMVFFFSRRLIGFYSRITLALDTKKIAAILGMFSCVAYMLLAGMTTPTVRACLMLLLLFSAVLLGRIRISLRAIALAMLAVVTWQPWEVISPSFQMSFAAAFSLLVWLHMCEKKDYSELKVVQTIGYFKGVWGASVIAGLATLPIAAWHFNYVSLNGFFANLLAIPVTGFWILPMGLLSLITMPLGGEKIFLPMMNMGLDVLKNIAAYAAGWKGGYLHIDPLIWTSLALVTLLALLAYMMKWGKVLMLTLPVWFLVLFLGNYVVPQPDIISLRGGKTVLMKVNEGYVTVLSDNSSDERRMLKRWEKDQNLTVNEATSKNCDSIGCVYLYEDKQILSLNEGVFPMEEDCRLNDVIFAPSESLLKTTCSSILEGDIYASFHLTESKWQKLPIKQAGNRVWR